jgi:hypothetical protein
MKNSESLEITGFFVGINCGKRRAEISNSARLSERVPELRTAGMVGSKANQTRQRAYYVQAPPACQFYFSRDRPLLIGVTVYRSISTSPRISWFILTFADAKDI